MIRGHVSNGASRVTLQLDDAGIAELREQLDALQLGRYDQVELAESCYLAGEFMPVIVLARAPA